jgi:hypothetical protein
VSPAANTLTTKELTDYREQLNQKLSLELYVPRHFQAANDSSTISDEMQFRFRGLLRDKETTLEELLGRGQVLVLAEPGGGKSIVARAAVVRLIETTNRLPLFVELKEYRGDLNAMLAAAGPDICFLTDRLVNGEAVGRSYILDGVDEVPREYLKAFGDQLTEFLLSHSSDSVFLTARQAFYVANKTVLPPLANVFHILDFGDEDIRMFLDKSGVDGEAFLAAIQRVDAAEEIRNPFVLSIMAQQFHQTGNLSELRSDNISYMIDSLLQTRPRFHRARQRRALLMIAVTMEIYARNELSQDEALRVIREAMHISAQDAVELLNELDKSILKRTTNGLAFQMRSYGEYLAAEELADAQMDRVKELSFFNRTTPNDSWKNTVSYLAELNTDVRAFFVRHFPLWMIPISPAALPDHQKDAVVIGVLDLAMREGQFISDIPALSVRQLSRLITPAMEAQLTASLDSANKKERGNALVVLGLLKKRTDKLLPLAFQLAMDQTESVRYRYCGIIALVNAGGPDLVPKILEAMGAHDPLRINILDVAGAICSEDQFDVVLPLIIADPAMLSSTYYHFREFTSKAALVNVLRYFGKDPNELNSYHAESYVEDILKLLKVYFDDEIADASADLFEQVEALNIFPDRSGPLPEIFRLLQEVDQEGIVARKMFGRRLATGRNAHRSLYFIDRELAALTTPQVAQWLIDENAREIIASIARYVSPHYS